MVVPQKGTEMASGAVRECPPYEQKRLESGVFLSAIVRVKTTTSAAFGGRIGGIDLRGTPAMALTDTAIRNAKPKAKPYKLADGGGLFLLVNPNGSRLWRQKYRVEGREKLISHGPYPDVGLARARERRDEARRLIAQGIDPSVARQEARRESEAGERGG
jgi:hypothetical protein